MSPQEIKALRKELNATAQELADTLGLDVKTVRSWESEQQFPTKKWVTALNKLSEEGPTGIKRRTPRKPTGFAALREPALWEIVRKLVAHPGLLDRVAKLAAEYDDPSDDA